MPNSNQESGPILEQRFKLGKLLGRGPSGVVYTATDLQTSQPCAVKRLHAHFYDKDILAKVRHDAIAAARLGHPALLAPYHIGLESTGALFLVFRFAQAESLATRLQRGPLSFTATLSIMDPLCAGLQLAHEAGLSHGGITPTNVLCGASGRVLLTDFGMSHLRATPKIKWGGAMGYAAPETLGDGAAVCSARGDLFALGAIVFECLTGQRMFSSTSLSTFQASVAHPPHIGSLLPMYEHLDAVLEMACAAQPEERFATAAALWRALQSSLFDGNEEAKLINTEPTEPVQVGSAPPRKITVKPVSIQPPDIIPSDSPSPSATTAPPPALETAPAEGGRPRRVVHAVPMISVPVGESADGLHPVALPPPPAINTLPRVDAVPSKPNKAPSSTDAPSSKPSQAAPSSSDPAQISAVARSPVSSLPDNARSVGSAAKEGATDAKRGAAPSQPPPIKPRPPAHSPVPLPPVPAVGAGSANPAGPVAKAAPALSSAAPSPGLPLSQQATQPVLAAVPPPAAAVPRRSATPQSIPTLPLPRSAPAPSGSPPGPLGIDAGFSGTSGEHAARSRSGLFRRTIQPIVWAVVGGGVATLFLLALRVPGGSDGSGGSRGAPASAVLLTSLPESDEEAVLQLAQKSLAQRNYPLALAAAELVQRHHPDSASARRLAEQASDLMKSQAVRTGFLRAIEQGDGETASALYAELPPLSPLRGAGVESFAGVRRQYIARHLALASAAQDMGECELVTQHGDLLRRVADSDRDPDSVQVQRLADRCRGPGAPPSSAVATREQPDRGSRKLGPREEEGTATAGRSTATLRDPFSGRGSTPDDATALRKPPRKKPPKPGAADGETGKGASTPSKDPPPKSPTEPAKPIPSSLRNPFGP